MGYAPLSLNTISYKSWNTEVGWVVTVQINLKFEAVPSPYALLMLESLKLMQLKNVCEKLILGTSFGLTFMPQELIKERRLPERAWIFFHVVTRRYAVLMRLLKKRGERGCASAPLDEFLGADAAAAAASERQHRGRTASRATPVDSY